jgi:hypothetical protein
MGKRSSMEDKRAAMLPNCLCNPAIAAMRVSGGAPDEVLVTVEVAGCMVISGGIVDAADEDCGGWLGVTVLDGAVEVLAMGLVKVTYTKLLVLDNLCRAYEWWTVGRGDGSRRRRADAVLPGRRPRVDASAMA